MKDGFSDEGSGNDEGNDGDGIKRHPDETAAEFKLRAIKELGSE